MQAGNESQVLVLGLGVSGLAAAGLALRQDAAVQVLDSAASDPLRARAEELRQRGARVFLEWNEPTWPDSVPDLAVISPGIAPASVLGRIAAAVPCPLLSELEYGFRHCACPILAVSGTNGKTTVVELLRHCLRHAGLKVEAAGNIGIPLSEAALRSAACDFVVAEVSSFQLEHVQRFTPLVAAILNVTPDHLDRYRDLTEYRNTKLRLLRNMTDSRRLVLREDLARHEDVRRALPDDGRDPIRFAADETTSADYFATADGKLCRRLGDSVQELLGRDELQLRGSHNVENVLAAFAVAQAAGMDPKQLVAPSTTFAPSPHRLELVAANAGIRYVNDSKATNEDALCRALAATAGRTGGRILLIAGGRDKNQNFTAVTALLGKCVKEVFLIGTCRQRLAKQWGHAVSCKVFVSLDAAVHAAADAAAPGDTVLLSPGCASQDMFADYAERGRLFCALVKRRLGE